MAAVVVAVGDEQLVVVHVRAPGHDERGGYAGAVGAAAVGDVEGLFEGCAGALVGRVHVDVEGGDCRGEKEEEG